MTTSDAPSLSNRHTFARVYEQSVSDVLPFLGDDRLEGLGRHNPAWGPGRHHVAAYLHASVARYENALAMLTSISPRLAPGSTLLDVGGFMGAFPLTLARLGYKVTLSERYDYYDGAFDDLCEFLVAGGVDVLDLDLTLAPVKLDKMYDAVTNMAMLEHLAHSPRVLMENMREALAPGGALIVEVPNVAYWPKRLAALRGESTLPPLVDVYQAAVPFTGHHREYTEGELRDVLDLSGFEVDELIAYNYTPRPDCTRRYYLLNVWPQWHFRSMREVLMARASVR